MIINEIQEKLFELQDVKYRDFMKKLIPTVDPATVIGIRTPDLRKLAAQLAGREDIGEFSGAVPHTYIAEFLAALPHTYFEENQLHAFLISGIRDFEKCLAEVERFLPYVNNWATCDQMSPKVFKKHRQELLPAIERWIRAGAVDTAQRSAGAVAAVVDEQKSVTAAGAAELSVGINADCVDEQKAVTNTVYTVRFGIGMLMAHYLDEDFDPVYPEMVAAVRSEEYYVRMMAAWYFATALAKQYEAVLPFIEDRRLDNWTHNKAIQKAIESYRITPEQKAYLRKLKVK